MDNRKKIIWGIVGVLATAGLVYVGYRWYKKSKTLSGNQTKDSRKITISRVN